MVVVSVEVDNCKEAKAFVFDTKKRIKGPKVHKGLYTAFKLEAYQDSQKLLICFGYALVGAQILNYIAFFLAIPLILFLGLSWWLMLPAILFSIPLILKLLGYWMLNMGLRKAGYKSRVKLLSNEEFILRGVLNGPN
jgi:hypothetical protein